jgi:hypothetical protein
MKAYGGVDVQIHIFLTSALPGGEWSALHPRRFNPGERTPGTYWIGVWVGPRTGLDDVEKRKFTTLPGLELRPLSRPASSQSLYRLRYSGSNIDITLVLQYHKLLLKWRLLNFLNLSDIISKFSTIAVFVIFLMNNIFSII